MTVLLTRGAEVSGRVITDNPDLLTRFDSVSLGGEFQQPFVTNVLSGSVTNNGFFTISGVLPGNYLAWIEYHEPANIYVKSMRLDGVDARDGFRIEGPSPRQMEIVLGDAGGALDGAVLNDKLAPSAATVVLVPNGSLRRRSTAYKVAVADPVGRFQLQAIAPGDYKLFAWVDVEANAWLDAEFLRTYEERGFPISVGEGTKASVRVTAIPFTPATLSASVTTPCGIK